MTECYAPGRSMSQANKFALAVLCGAHFVADTYATLLYPLLPLLATSLGLSPRQVFTLAPTYAITSALMQPVYGFISDRYSQRAFAVLGPAVTATFISLVGLASSYEALVACLIIGGVGAGAFHPQAAAIASWSSGSFRRLGVSLFSSSGMLGQSLGPILIASIVGATNLSKTYYVAGFGWLATLLLFRYCPSLDRPPRDTIAGIDRSRKLIRALKSVRSALIILYLVTVSRVGMQMLIANYWPFLLKARGQSVQAIGAVLTAYFMAAALGSFFGGALAERFGGRAMNRYSGFVTAIFLIAAVLLSGLPSIVCLVFGAAALMSTTSVNVALAQEVAPGETSTVSALMMGFAWGIGALAPAITEPLTRVFSMQTVLIGAATIPLATALLAAKLPEDRIVRSPVVEGLGAPGSVD